MCGHNPICPKFVREKTIIFQDSSRSFLLHESTAQWPKSSFGINFPSQVTKSPFLNSPGKFISNLSRRWRKSGNNVMAGLHTVVTNVKQVGKDFS